MIHNLQYKAPLALIALFWCFTATAQYSEGDLLKEANTLFDRRAYADAMPMYAQLLSLNPTSPELNYKYGATAIYGDASKKDEAIKYLKFATSKGGVDPKVWYFLGRAYHLNYQFADASAAYRKYQSLDSKEAENLNVGQDLAACESGLQLLSQIKDIQVLDKKQSASEAFFRNYDLSKIGGKILVTPEDLLTALDRKNNHTSLIHFRGPGSDVYFSSYGKDGKDGLDIYRAQVLPDGSFSSPQKLPATINSPYDDDYPFLHPDNKTFYFSSKGHNSMGGYDVFQSLVDIGSGTYSKPENLDFAVNTPDDELFYIADSTKNLANFASARSSRQGQLHVYTVKVEGIPLELTLVKGIFVNKVDPAIKLAKITVIDAASNKEVDSQFTDPNSGDYVLSFPRSGRYKLLVEVDKGQTVHSGSVAVPKSQGLSAYLQEMELVKSAGLEKLVINNLFDQSYQGDVMALAQKILRQRSQLDVNYDPTKEVEKPDEKGSDIDLAYHSAGFSIGLSNEQILAQTAQRVVKAAQEEEKAKAYQATATQVAADRWKEAEAVSISAQDAIAEASAASEARKPELMFRAALRKMNAEEAIRKAVNADGLVDQLSSITQEQSDQKLSAEKANTELRAALESKNYDAVVASLKAEKSRQELEAELSTAAKPLDAIQIEASQARTQSDAAMAKAGQARQETAAMERELINKNRLRESAKGKDAKVLDEEIIKLKSDLATLTDGVDKRYASAEKLLVESRNQQDKLELFKSIENGEIEAASASTATLNPSRKTSIETNLADIEIDEKAVAQYITDNPGALASVDASGQSAAFAKRYAANITADSAVLVYGSTETMTSEQIIDSEVETIATNSKNDGSKASPEAGMVGENESTTAENSTLAAKPDKRGEITTPPLPAAAAGAISSTSENKSNGKEELAASESNASPDPINTAQSSSLSQTSQEETSELISTAQVTTPEVKSAVTTSEKVKIQNRIEAEKVKVNAAIDWIAIIDQSILELERGVGGSDDLDPEDLQEQLDQYTKLRESKLAEKQASEGLVTELRNELTTDKEKMAYAKAIEDVNALDASLYARIEAKVEDASSKPTYIKSISQVNRDYIPQLVSIELSGVSAPELAEQRIALNKSLISDLDILISGQAVSEIAHADLIELRRIKAIEILQDEQIRVGAMQYRARTPEAKEYTELISDSPTDNINTVQSTPTLSPALESKLKSDYSRELMMPGYGAELSAINLSDDQAVQVAKRIKLRESYLGLVQSEIQLYALTIESEEVVQPVVLNRYNTLLNDRSLLIDEIQADKKLLKASEEITNVEFDQKSTAEVLALSESVVRDAQADLTKDLASLEKMELSPADRERATSATYQKSANKLDAQVTSLVSQQDMVSSDGEREALQVQIQTISELAQEHQNEANKWFEDFEASFLADISSNSDQVNETTVADPILTPSDRADNTSAGSEVVQKGSLSETSTTLAALPAEIVIENRPDQTLTEEPSSLPEISNTATKSIQPATANENQLTPYEIAIPQSSVNPVVLEGVNYKSLKANLSNEVLVASSDSLSQIQAQLAALKDQYELETAAAEKALIVSESERLVAKASAIDDRLVATLAKSNAEEIKYYQATNDGLMSALKDQDGNDPSMINTLSAKMAEISNDLSENERKALSGRVTEGERVEEELIIIARLESLNQTLVERTGAYGNLISTNSVAPGPIESKTENFAALAKGRTYITEEQNTELGTMTEIERASAISQTADLKIDTTFVNLKLDKASESLLLAATPIDQKGYALLKTQPNHYQYVAASVKADSLKTLERQQADRSLSWMNRIAERNTEIQRLQNMAEHESVAKNREVILKRIESFKAESDRDLTRAAIASEQAEALRSSRMTQEAILADNARKLTASELTELNALVDRPTYAVIPVNLASTEPISAAPRPTAPAKSVEVETPSALVESKISAEAALAPKASRSGLSVDEERMLTATGTWLSMFEIIAEKDDFTDVTERLFVETDGSVYSASKPIPLEVTMPKGLVFQVQIGAFRNPIPQDLFTDVAPVMGVKLPNGITRYRAGIFKSYKDAVAAKNLVRSKGYADAFVVAYVDGEQLTGDQAQAILNQASQLLREETAAASVKAVVPDVAENSNAGNNTDAAPLNQNTPTEALNTAYYNDPEAAKASQVEASTGLFYTVQVGVYSKPVKLDQLFNLTELNSELTAGKLIRYTSGRYKSTAAAADRKGEVIAQGISDAFITAYYNGRKISLAEAEKLQQDGEAISSGVKGSSPEPVRSTPPPVEKILYTVVLGSFIGDIPQEVANAFLDQPNLQVRRVIDAESRTIYYSQPFETSAEAERFLDQIQAAGITEARIGTIVAGKLQAAP